MSKNIVIVESPAKAKTIKSFLGEDFEVVSSYGHVSDLPQKEMGIDIENNFKPNYIVNPDKKEIVKKLKSLVKGAEYVWLASDEDREGEAIAWHLYNTLKLKKDNTKRIVFHEITKKAIQKAVENPRDINYNLVDAQQARRILDRLVGYEMSPVLWKKVKRGLSAGRVQSVAVRLIVEREKEIKSFKESSYFKTLGKFLNNKNEAFKSVLDHNFKDEDETKKFLEEIKQVDFFVKSVEKKPSKRNPSPPFTTSTLQQEASRKLGFSVNQTMRLAQGLYENGYITYMRTDSVSLSEEAKGQASQEIKNLYGEKYVCLRNFKTKSKSAQEAHEAIRPTSISDKNIDTEDIYAKKLYDLIWKRTISSQMSEAILDKTIIRLKNDKNSHEFVSEGEVVIFDGFLKVYKESTDDDEDRDTSELLPTVENGEKVIYKNIICTQKFTKHPPRYAEASLVRKLEDLGIGRPSTYAPTISTIQKRNYVEKKDMEGVLRKYKEISLNDKLDIKHEEKEEKINVEKKKIFPTDIGIVVTDFLTENFTKILDYNFTAQIEERFDNIAAGNEIWNDAISLFYSDFHEMVEKVKENSEKITGERILGEDPKSGKQVSVRIGRYGPMAQIGTFEDEQKPKFAGLKPNQNIDSITLKEALELFDLPKVVGMYRDKEILASVGRFGPYLKYDNFFVSVKDIDVLDISLDEAIKMVNDKIEQEKSKYILTFDEEQPIVQVLNGRYGPFIKIGKNNVKIPKDLDPKTLTRERCLEIRDKYLLLKKNKK